MLILDPMRMIKCNKCGREIEVRSSFAYMTYSNHVKACKEKK